MAETQKQPESYKDRFSKQSDQYASGRPHYPDEIFEFLSGVTPAHELAWDCGTGNGQAAIKIAKHFDHVVATDASEEQIMNAIAHDKISFQIAPAEQAPLDDNSVDLITVATAIHWFDLEKFYDEVRRILKHDGVLACWAYGFMECTTPVINDLFKYAGTELLEPYWDENVKMIWGGYQDMPFPFEDIEHGPWVLDLEWTRHEFSSYLLSWSGAQNYLDQTGRSVIEEIGEKLETIWPDPEQTHKFVTPLTSRVGRYKRDS